jgi:hypothetical protein
MRRVPTILVALSAAAALVVLALPASAADHRSFSVEPTSVRAGQEVTASGRGCDRRALVRIYLDGIQIDTDRANRRGRFSEDVRIPNSTDPGEHRMRARCSGHSLGSVKIRVRGGTTFTVGSDTVQAGKSVRVSGTGCRPGSFVTIRLDRRLIGTIHANSEGRFSRRVVIPRTTRTGRYIISARCGNRFVGSESIRVTPAYPAPTTLVTTDRTAVAAGQKVTVSGTDCPTGQPMASLDGQPINLNVDYTTKGKGFTGTAAIPATAAPGKHRLSAGCDAGSAGTTELNVLDPDASDSAADRQAFGSQGSSDLAMWAGLFAGLALLVASVAVTRRRRS